MPLDWKPDPNDPAVIENDRLVDERAVAIEAEMAALATEGYLDMAALTWRWQVLRTFPPLPSEPIGVFDTEDAAKQAVTDDAAFLKVRFRDDWKSIQDYDERAGHAEQLGRPITYRIEQVSS